MNMQDQMRKAFGHYARRQIARAHMGKKRWLDLSSILCL